MADREKLIEMLKTIYKEYSVSPSDDLIANYLISHGVTVRGKGEWVTIKDNTLISPCYECSVCGRRMNTFGAPQVCAPFCHCGADMRGII